ncbi:glycosyltransferase family 4 protein [Candidatus Pacearchaeota archaeon]|nr:glycosyltransferase family 4 protein [Candidatus Pacearchaeota archaeon]
MKIDLIANDGSPLGVTPPDIYGRGIGGAELSMMNLMETFAARDHEVRVYNDPIRGGLYDGVEYIDRKKFNPREARDILIIFRSPNPLMIGALAKEMKIWWSMDQYTIGSFASLAELVDYAVTISPYHTKYHIDTYNIPADKIGHIDLGVRLSDYEQEVKKIEGRMIFCSIPDRGLPILHAAWPLIHREVPQASLRITSDYTLWGAQSNVSNHRLNWSGLDGVKFLGNIPRNELVKLQLEAEIMPYPCVYQELFCISAAECQVAGTLPITTTEGALPTTNEFGITVTGDLQNPNTLQNNFVDRIVSLLREDRAYLEERRKTMSVGAKLRFDWVEIAKKWERLFEERTL